MQFLKLKAENYPSQVDMTLNLINHSIDSKWNINHQGKYSFTFDTFWIHLVI